MTVVVVHDAKIVTCVCWEMIDAKNIMHESFTILLSIFFMMTCGIFRMAVVFQYVITINLLCWQSIHKMILVEELFL